MGSEEDRCAEAFQKGDLSALRAAVAETMMNGLFYGIDGMRVGGTRRLEIAPHLAYGEKGVPGVIPENALIISEITILGTVESIRR
jgi:FKBP-type peptidyl-prolyl cis-trans isomerase